MKRLINVFMKTYSRLYDDGESRQAVFLLKKTIVRPKARKLSSRVLRIRNNYLSLSLVRKKFEQHHVDKRLRSLGGTSLLLPSHLRKAWRSWTIWWKTSCFSLHAHTSYDVESSKSKLSLLSPSVSVSIGTIDVACLS